MSRKSIFRIGAAGLSFLIVLTVLEIAARARLPRSTLTHFIRKSADSQLKDELIPGVKTSFHGLRIPLSPTEVAISDQGFRDRHFAVPKPPGMRRILCLGDSFTFGWGVQANEAWPKVLEEIIAETGRKVECVNMGVPGYGLAQEVRLLETKGFALDPDLVLFGIVGDDLNDVQGRVGKKSAFEFLNWLAMRRRVRASESDKPNFNRAEETLNRLGLWAGDRRIPILFVLLNFIPEQDRFLRLLNRHDFPVIDLTQIQEEPLNRFSDIDRHPNARGHRLLAENMETQVIKMMDRAKDR